MSLFAWKRDFILSVCDFFSFFFVIMFFFFVCVNDLSLWCFEKEFWSVEDLYVEEEFMIFVNLLILCKFCWFGGLPRLVWCCDLSYLCFVRK